MKPFMDKDFLLETDTAKRLYHEYAAKVPIIDYHCHINPREIAENRRFENITQVWLGGDHYKWRLMRSNGVEEKYITGDATDREKFQKWAETLEKAIGNPLYHWSHLELRKYFNYQGDLNAETAEEVWGICNDILCRDDMRVRNIMEMSNVELIGTTDDPIDSLEWHKQIVEDKSFPVKVLPMWRPDNATCIEKPEFLSYIRKLESVSGVKIESFGDFTAALQKRLDYFQQNGCTGSDHGLLYIPFRRASEEQLNAILLKGLNGEAITLIEEEMFKTESMLFLGKEYSERNWVMQLHFGATRNNNTTMYKRLGPDTGFDGIYNGVPLDQLSSF